MNQDSGVLAEGIGAGTWNGSKVNALLGSVLAVVCVVSLFAGYQPIGFWEAMTGLLSWPAEQDKSVSAIIMQEIRFPRTFLAVIIGASLGAAGAALQGLFRNPLAEPGIMGVSASAGFGGVVSIYFGLGSLFWFATPLIAIASASVTMTILLLISLRDTTPLTLILAGVALSSLAVSFTSLAMNLSPNPFALSEMIFWLLGSVRDRSLVDVGISLPFMAVGWGLLAVSRRSLDALSLGEDVAQSLGVDLRRIRQMIILGTTLCVGASVAVAGAIGFVGLVVPHVMRPLVGHMPSSLLLPSALGGGLLLLAADIVVRLLPGNQELMLGVLTSFIGVPFFLYLILKRMPGL